MFFLINLAVYRASFRLTYAEMYAPTGEWKSILAGVLFALAISGWISIYIRKYGEISCCWSMTCLRSHPLEQVLVMLLFFYSPCQVLMSFVADVPAYHVIGQRLWANKNSYYSKYATSKKV